VHSNTLLSEYKNEVLKENSFTEEDKALELENDHSHTKNESKEKSAVASIKNKTSNDIQTEMYVNYTCFFAELS
jgi:hypothetical protein